MDAPRGRRRGTLQFCVLAVLAERDHYGFELVRTLGEEADGLVTSEGTIYPLLSRLRKEGLVKTSWVESAEGPPRRYYRLTTQGAAALSAFRAQWEPFRDGVDRLLAGVQA